MMRWLARAWFPLATVALMLLALPGLALFVAHVLGYESNVNFWLEERIPFSFHVALPLWAAGLLLAVPFLLVLLYFLKLKRKALAVPSTFLWKKSIEDLHVNSLFQWLRRNVLLLLQLLAILGLIYAVLAPRFFAKAGQGGRFVILVDNSASMSATDVTPNRLEQAKLEALAEIDAAGDSDAGMVIAFNSSAEIRQSFTTNKQMLRSAVREIQPTQRPTQILEALALADSLANPTRSTEDNSVRPEDSPRTFVPTEGTETAVHLFSDGRFADAPDFALGNLRLQFHSAGQPGIDVDNVGLVSLSANRDEYDPGLMFVTAGVRNYRSQAAKIDIELQVFVAGRTAKEYKQTLALPARAYQEAAADDGPRTIKDQPGEGTAKFEIPEVDDTQEVTLRARLIKHQDVFPLDDEAFLIVGVVRRAKVLIVGPINKVFDSFFDDPATKLVTDVTKLPREALADKSKYLDPVQKGQYDLVIFDRCAPDREEDMPQANTLFIGRPPPPWQMPDKPQVGDHRVERVDQPVIKGWVNQHGLLRYLTGLHEVGIFEAYRISGEPPRTPRLMEGDRNLLLLFTLSRGAFTDAVLAFPIVNDAGEWNTNWPLLPSFPLFLRNVVYSLGNIRDAAAEENVQPGQVKTLKPGPGVDRIAVTPPGGTAATLDRGTRSEFSFGATDKVGTYQVEWSGGARRFAVNLLDGDESNLQPRPSVTIGAIAITANAIEKRPRELWRWLVLGALAVVLVEWYVYNRRVYV